MHFYGDNLHQGDYLYKHPENYLKYIVYKLLSCIQIQLKISDAK